MSDGQSPLRSRGTALLVAVVYAVLSVVLLMDLLHARESGLQILPERLHGVADIAASMGSARGVNTVIAVASMEIGADDVVLTLPQDYQGLLTRDADSFAGRVQPILNGALLKPWLGAEVRVVEYDPILTQAESVAVEAAPDTIVFPMDVYAVSGTEAVREVRLYTDPSRTRVYLAPVGAIKGVRR